MKNTYTRTLMISDLRTAKVSIDLYEGCKYTAKSVEDLGKQIHVEYTGLVSWDVIEGGEEAKEIIANTDGTCIDEFDEYLVLHFEDGSEATFRNSHVDMFVR